MGFFGGRSQEEQRAFEESKKKASIERAHREGARRGSMSSSQYYGNLIGSGVTGLFGPRRMARHKHRRHHKSSSRKGRVITIRM